MLVIAFWTNQSVWAQDNSFSQFFASGVSLNPAMAGSHICPRIKFYYSDLWPSVPSAYVVTSLMFDFYSFQMKSGFSFDYTHDSQGQGILQTHTLKMAYSKEIKLTSSWTATGGLTAGYVFQYLDWTKLQFADQLDFQYGFINPTQATPPNSRLMHYPDFGVGISVEKDRKLFLGFGAYHLSRPKIGFYGEDRNRLNMKFSAHVGYVIPLQNSYTHSKDAEKNASITPVGLFEIQGPYKQIIAGGYFSKQPFLGGLFMRHTIHNLDAVIVVFGFQQPQYALRYSFDITLSPLTLVSSGGGHELTFTWLFGCPEPIKKRYKQVKCPSFLK